MTIIEPKKNKFKVSFLWLMITSLVLIEAVFSIFAYSQNVRLSHELKDAGKNIENLQISVSEFKKQLYAKLELQNVDQLAGKLGLVREKKPEYLSAR